MEKNYKSKFGGEFTVGETNIEYKYGRNTVYFQKAELIEIFQNLSMMGVGSLEYKDIPRENGNKLNLNGVQVFKNSRLVNIDGIERLFLYISYKGVSIFYGELEKMLYDMRKL